jgi:hypothetical protein
MAEELNMDNIWWWIALAILITVLLYFGIWDTRDPKKDRRWSRTNDPNYRPNNRGPSMLIEPPPPKEAIELEETPRYKTRGTHGPPKKKE